MSGKVNISQTLRKFFWDSYDNPGILILSNLLSFSLWLILALALRLTLAPFLNSILLNLLPFLLALPVSLAGLFYISHLIVSRERLRGVRDFFFGLKRYFVRSLLLGLIFSLLLIMVSSSLSFYHQVKIIGAILGGINIWIFFLFFLMGMYSFPLMVEQNITLGKALKRSAWLALDNPLFTIAISVQAVAMVLLCLVSVIGLLFLVMSLVSLLFSRAMKEVLGKYEGREEKEERRSLREIIRPWE